MKTTGTKSNAIAAGPHHYRHRFASGNAAVLTFDMPHVWRPTEFRIAWAADATRADILERDIWLTVIAADMRATTGREHLLEVLP